MNLKVKEILQAALLSEKVYDFKSTLTFRTSLFQDILNTASDVRVGVHHNKRDRTLYIVFEGTNSLRDWVRNFNKELVPTPFGKIHKGFYTAYNDCKDWIYKQIKDFNPKKVVFTGHSLGGAIASVAYSETFMHELCTLVTFGAPRVGDTEFCMAKFSSAQCLRVRHTNDIVPRLPKIGYDHPRSTLYYINSYGQVVHNPSTLSILFDRLQDFLYGKANIIVDHSMYNYRSALIAQLSA